MIEKEIPVKPGTYIKQLIVDEDGSREEWVEVRMSRVATDSRFEGDAGNRTISDIHGLEAICPRGGSQRAPSISERTRGDG